MARRRAGARGDPAASGLPGSERWPLGPFRFAGCRSLVLAIGRSLGRAGRHRGDTDRNNHPVSCRHSKLRERKHARRPGDDHRRDERSPPRDYPQLRCRRAKRRNDGDRAVDAVLSALRSCPRARHAALRAHAPRQREPGSNTGRRRRLSHHQPAARAERIPRVARRRVWPNLPGFTYADLCSARDRFWSAPFRARRHQAPSSLIQRLLQRAQKNEQLPPLGCR